MTPDLRMFSASRKAADALKAQGVRVATPPVTDTIPRLPADITSPTDQALMDLFVQFTSWLDFISAQVACAQVDEKNAERDLADREAFMLASGWTGSRNDRVAVNKAKQATDPEVLALREELEERYSYRKLIESIATSLERDAALISRELTRRTSGSTPSVRANKYL